MWNKKKVIGIIAEYNPLHNGHIYLLEKARKIQNVGYVIVVMSGNFVQRGEPGIIHKKDRAQIAIVYGVDLVIENPAIGCTGNMTDLIHFGVTILNALDIIDYIIFGSECGNISFMTEIAEIMSSSKYNEKFNYLIKNEYTSNEARNCICSSTIEKYGYDLNSANNLVGCYIVKELILQNSTIKPITVKRKGQGYFDNEHEYEKGQFLSATTLRKALLYNHETINQKLFFYMPMNVGERRIGKDIALLNFDDVLNYVKKIYKALDFKEIENIYGAGEIDIDRFFDHLSDSDTGEAIWWGKNVKYKRFLIRFLLGITTDLVITYEKYPVLTEQFILAYSHRGKEIINDIAAGNTLALQECYMIQKNADNLYACLLNEKGK